MDKIDQLDALMAKGVEEGVYPGATYCLIEEDDVHFGCVGMKALVPQEEDNALDTVYDIASLSKVIGTTTALLKLCESGDLSFDDKIKSYLPYIKYDHVTIRDLMAHMSGYPALTEGTTEMTTVDPLMDDLMDCDLVYDTGSKVVYSDVGFMYLGFLVEKLTGSMPDYLEKHVFGPLKMVDTRYNHKEIMRIAPTEDFGFRGMIRGFIHDEKAFLLGGVAGHAGLYSTVKDLSVFAKMILNNGEYDGLQILRKTTIDDLYVPIIREDHEDERSLGWIIRSIGHERMLYHTGYTGTNIMIDRDNNKAFIMLSNRVHPTRENTKIIKFRRRIEKIIYGE